jgi:hypothetical protein
LKHQANDPLGTCENKQHVHLKQVYLVHCSSTAHDRKKRNKNEVYYLYN